MLKGLKILRQKAYFGPDYYSGRAQMDGGGIYDQVLTIEVLTVTNLTK